MWIHRRSGEEGAFQAVSGGSKARRWSRHPVLEESHQEGKEGQGCSRKQAREPGWVVRSRKATVASLQDRSSGVETCSLARRIWQWFWKEERVGVGGRHSGGS